MNESKETTAAIKLIIGSLPYQGISVINTMKKVMEYLCIYYEKTLEKKYLEIAIMHMRAYIEMGFVYDELKRQFDFVLTLAGVSKKEIYRNVSGENQSTKKMSKSEIRSMIRRWTSSKYHTKSKDEVVEDIMDKVERRSMGIYYYHSNQNPKNPKSDDVYALVINEFESYFHDIKRNKYFKLL